MINASVHREERAIPWISAKPVELPQTPVVWLSAGFPAHFVKKVEICRNCAAPESPHHMEN
jgi:hypothetical protein